MPSERPRELARGKHLSLLDLGGWEFASRVGCTSVVAISARTDDDHLVLVRQHRPAIGGPCLELPAGLVGDSEQLAGEAPLEAARRELLEETGYQAETWFEHACGFTSAGLTDERITLFGARDLHKVTEGGGVDGENIETVLAPIQGFQSWVDRQRDEVAGIDLKVYLALVPWET